MTKDAFYDSICCELEFLQHLLEKCEKKLNKSIKGHIYIRENKKSKTFYQVIQANNERQRTNISNQPEFIKKLLVKAYNHQLQRICRNNIKALKQTLKKYQPLLPMEALKPNEKASLLEISQKIPLHLTRRHLMTRIATFTKQFAAQW